MNNKEKQNKKAVEKPGMSRREAIRKAGYAAFASSTMLLLLNNPTKVHANSPGDPGEDWDWGSSSKSGDKKDDNDDDWGSEWDNDWN